jgi:hypothetical protein
MKKEKDDGNSIDDGVNISSGRKDKIISFINSPFFIWFMSSCILSLITFVYNLSQERLEKEKIIIEQEYIIRQRVEKLDNEIYLRLDNNITWLIEWSVRNSDNKSNDLFMPFNPCKRLVNSPELDNMYYPEFKNRNLMSLLLELKEAVNDKSDVENLNKTIRSLKYLKSEFYYKTKFDIKDYRRFISKLDLIYMSRWDPITNMNKETERVTSKLDSLNQVFKEDACI